MTSINRNSAKSAEILLEKFIPDESTRLYILQFFAEAILLADKVAPNNWNINLGKKGKMMRMNVGRSFCIQLSHSANELLILGLRDELVSLNLKEGTYVGYIGEKRIVSTNPDDCPTPLLKIPNSLGYLIPLKNITQRLLSKIQEANFNFIHLAKNDTMLANSKNAHSLGVLLYFQELGLLPNLEVAYDEKSIEAEENKAVKRLPQDINKLEKLAKLAKGKPEQYVLKKKIYYARNQALVQYVKRKANGICQDCLQPAPFRDKKTGEPFLEVHHIIPLAEGGDDTLENTIALCPNCHRKRHFG